MSKIPDNLEATQLKSFVQRIERLHEEKKAISGDIADVYQEAKGFGYDVKVLREVIKRRARDPNEVRETEEIIDLYMAALGAA